MHMPVLDRLLSLRDRSWLHMPGHGGVLPWLDAALDVTELEASDDLNAPVAGGAIERAQSLAARACGAGATLFLTGGSTQGIQAMLTAYVPPGGKVILPRDAHKSAIDACAIGDLRPVYVWLKEEDGRAFVCGADIASAMLAHPDASAVLVTRPDYYGVCADLSPVIACAKVTGMRVLVDEAHGAHYPYGGSIASAGKMGADAWVQSAHKTLPALTQGAYLHLKNALDGERLRDRASLLGTSSPSFLVAASLDWARAQMSENGVKWINGAMERNQRLFSLVQPLDIVDANAVLRARGIACDGTRAVLDIRALGLSGYELLSALAQRGIDIEMADDRRIVALAPLSADEDAMDALAEALFALPKGESIPLVSVQDIPHTEALLTPREAVFGENVFLPADRAAGRVAARAVGLYPPGVPIAMPGERISEEIVQALGDAQRKGARTFGLTREGFFCCSDIDRKRSCAHYQKEAT